MTLHRTRMHAAATLLAAAGLVVVAFAAPSAQGRRGGANNLNTGTPTATNAIADNPEAFYGKPVTISAGVERILSKTVFLVDQRKAVSPTEVRAIGKPMLVIAPYLIGSLTQREYLLMRGEIVKFDAAAIARAAADYKLDVDPEVAAQFKGQPVLVASSILNATSVEVAKKPPPPPRPEDLALTALMKTINPAFTALRTAAQESNAAVVTENVKKLTPAFSQTESIWDGVGQSPAAEWAREARGQAASIESAAAAGDWEAVKTSAAALNQTCQSCHGVYRERLDDGTFRMKQGSF